MATVEEIEVSYRSQIASPAQADAAALDAVADGLDKVADSVEVTDAKIQRSTKSGVGFRNSLDAVTKSTNALQSAQNKLIEVTQAVSDSVRRGEITQAEAARTIDAQAAKVQKLTQTHEAAVQASKGATVAVAETTETARLSSQQMGILADEAHKFFDQVMAGGSAFQAAFYQLPNMIQIMGGFGSALETVAGWMVGPAGLVVAGAAAAAAVYKVGSSAEAEQEQLATLSQHLRATRDDYTAMASAAEVAARQLSAGSGLSLDDSRSVTTTFAAVPTIDSSSLTSLTQEARDLAEVMGETVPEAAKDMASAYADPAKAAQDFADKGLLGVHQGLVSQVKDLQDSGNRMQAWQLLMQQLGSATQGATNQGLTPFQQALRNLKDSWDGPIQGAKQLTSAIGDGIVSAATKGINALASMGSSLQSVKKWMDSFQPEHVAYETRQRQAQQGSSSGMSGLIDMVGQQIGANSDVISLAHRIQPVESSIGQYDRNGAVVTSSAGAIGGMQVMSSNAAGYDLTDPTGNVTAAERLLVRLYSKYSGNEQLVAMAYNWGEGNVDKYLQGNTTVPQSVQDYAQKVTGGQMYGATTLATMQGKVDDALKTSDGSTASQVTDQTNAIKQLTSAQEALDTLHKAGAVSDADYAARTQDLTQRLMTHKGALNDLRDPMQELAHQQQQATDAAWAGTAAQKAMVQVDQQVEEAARKMGQSHATAAQLLKAESNEQQLLTGQFNSAIDAMDRKTSAQNTLLSSYDASKGSLDDYLRSVEASDTVQATSIAGTQEQARQTAVLTDALKRQAEAQVDITTARKAYGQSLDLETIKAEATAIGQDSDAVSVQMAVLKERNALLENGADLTSKASQTDLDNVAAIQTATNAYQKQQDTLNELTSDISSAADTLSSSFTQALVNASNGGVTFKSAMQGVESQLISVIAKLALINPLLTAIDGKSRTTLGDVSSILSGASSPSISDGAAAISQDSGGWGWNPLASAGSSASSASGLGGSTSWLSSGLKTNLFGTATVGNLLGGIGGGFGIGSALSGIGGGRDGTLGSGIGSGIGALAGSFIPGVGTLIGGLVGGGLGGLLGGLFGHKKNPYTIDQVMTTGGSLSLGKTWNQAQTDEITAQLTSDLSSINSVLSATGSSIGIGGDYLGTVRSDKNNKDKSLQSVSLTDLLKNATLTSSDATFNQALSQGMPSDITDVSTYTAAIQSLKTMADTVDQLGVAVSKFNSDGTVTVGSFTQATGDLKTALDTALDGKSLSTSDLQTQISTITTFVDTTMPGLLKATVSGQQSWVDQMATLKATYDAAATQANQYGLDGSQLKAKYQSLYDQGFASQLDTLRQSDLSVQARYQTATGDDEGAALTNFDLSADQQRQQLADNWKNFLGDAYTSQQEYISQSADLEKTLSAERLQIQAQYNGTSIAQMKQYQDQAEQSVTSVFSNLTDYARGLNTSDASPLSAQAQYQASNDNLMSDYQAAMGGDYDALSRIQSDASTFLTDSKTYQGSGTGYASDFSQVSDLLKNLGKADTDKLTASLVTKLSQQSNDLLKTLTTQMGDLTQVVTTMQKQLQLKAVTDATRPRAA
ncbi:phage tail length tape measure family protein [Gluconobacter kondonii]|uniref:phage tail length tape measure family protein n=1 Tax=Gluconobacter kondonii TaxID=941463 RepID=UPI001B8C8B93|nr:phage tail length tape measure family protein [Gluconobacter kondonii]MBS1065967.1 phage tail length tape measure family protein [Gluconobacter kondonii]